MQKWLVGDARRGDPGFFGRLRVTLCVIAVVGGCVVRGRSGGCAITVVVDVIGCGRDHVWSYARKHGISLMCWFIMCHGKLRGLSVCVICLTANSLGPLLGLFLLLLLIIGQPVGHRTGHELGCRNGENRNQRGRGEQAGGEVLSGGGSNVHGGGVVCCTGRDVMLKDGVSFIVQNRLSQSAG